MNNEIENNVTEFVVNTFEYCTVAEKTYLPADEVKVYIPKLTTFTNKGRVRAQYSILCNDPDCKPTSGGLITLDNAIIVKTFSGLELSKSAVVKKEECGCTFNPCGGADYCTCSWVKDCKGNNTTFIDGHIVEAYLPEGAQMIVCFMDNNVNDGYLTNFI
jgi:hypothetical protein